jgi:NAD(P)H-hydrate epimerase
MEKVTDVPSLPPRPLDAHKGSFGKVLIIGGSVGMTGAPALAGRAALRAGAGLVRIATAKSALPVVAAIEPCCTTIPLAEDRDGKISAKALPAILRHLPQNDVVAFGPGIGISADLKDMLATVIAQPNLRLVIDADGLNNLAQIKNFPKLAKASIILTPHPGEMKTLWKSLFREPLPRDRTDQARTLAQKTSATVILKGASTVVTDSDRVYINTTGNPGMATAGSGDVLTGIIAAIAGQGLDNFDASVAAAYLHGLAGDIAAQTIGYVSLIATDIIDALPHAFTQ